MTSLTQFQRLVLRSLFKNAGAVNFAGAWVFATDIRRDANLAAAMYWAFVRDMD